MCNEKDYDMKEAVERYNALPPFALIKGMQGSEKKCAGRMLYSPAQVLNLIENGYRGKVIAGEWMDGIALGLTSIPVFMVQPVYDGVCSFSESDTWEVAKAWMDMANMPVITRICDRIVECNYEIGYEF